MEVITIQLEAFKEIMSKLDNIQRKVQKISNRKKALENEMIDTFEACRILKVCRRTLERYRISHGLAYTKINRRIFYKVSDIEKLMGNNLIKPNTEKL
jgi:hypothetical protein